MEQVVFVLRRWLAERNIPLEGAELHVVLLDKTAAGEARARMRLEANPYMLTSGVLHDDIKDRIRDMPVVFTAAPRR